MSTQEGLRYYLRRAVKYRAIAAKTSRMVLQLWGVLDALVEEDLSIPNALPGEDGQVFLSWEKGGYYMDLEVFPDGRVELFSSDGFSTLWDAEFTIGGSPPPELAQHLVRFRNRVQADADVS